MSWHNKVVWNEGLFLRPQTFQQQERYFEHFAHKRASLISPFFFGFEHYGLDTEALAVGKVILQSASGVFPDGTPFEVPGDTPPPEPLTILSEHLTQVIYLAVPIRVPNGEETTFDKASDSLARYTVFNADLRDSNSIGRHAHTMPLSALRLRLIPEKEMGKAWIGLALTRVNTIHADASITLENTLIPPVLGYGASSLLSTWLAKICDLTVLRANALAQLLTGADGNAQAAQVSDYLMLQILNRYEMQLRTLQNVPAASPADFHALLLSMAGELSTYARPTTRRPLESYPPYKHTEPYSCIKPLFDDMLMLLNAVLIRSAQRIELRNTGRGLYSAVVDPAEIQGYTAIVLTAHADASPDVLQRFVLDHMKVGPSEYLPDLIRSHLAGMVLQPMPVASRQIPFRAGYLYFEILRTGPLWKEFAQRGGLTIHVPEGVAALQLELWGVRE